MRSGVRPARHRRVASGRGCRSETPRKPKNYLTFPLVAAAKNNDLAMVQMLLEHGANPDAQTDEPEVALLEALEHGNRDMANLIASYGGSLPVHCMDIVTLAAVLHQNPKLAPFAIYIPNPERPKEATQALRWRSITASIQTTSACGRSSEPAATRIVSLLSSGFALLGGD